VLAGGPDSAPRVSPLRGRHCFTPVSLAAGAGRDIGNLADCQIAKNVGSNKVREATAKIWRFEPPPVAELLYMRLSPVLPVKLTNWWLRSDLNWEIAGVAFGNWRRLRDSNIRAITMILLNSRIPTEWFTPEVTPRRR
jgi:hypothetical protein